MSTAWWWAVCTNCVWALAGCGSARRVRQGAWLRRCVRHYAIDAEVDGCVVRWWLQSHGAVQVLGAVWSLGCWSARAARRGLRVVRASVQAAQRRRLLVPARTTMHGGDDGNGFCVAKGVVSW